MCRAHVRGLRQVPCFRQSKIVLVPESNLDVTQDISEDLLATEPGLTVLAGRENRYGVRTGSGSHEQYVNSVSKRFAEGAVSYHKTIVTANPFADANTPPSERVAAARKEFERQLRSFRKVMLLPKSILSAVRVAHSGRVGKGNERSARLRDDMCMAFILGVFWSGHHIVGTVLEYGRSNRLIRPAAPGDRVRAPPRGAIGGAVAYKPHEILYGPAAPPGAHETRVSGRKRKAPQ